MHFNTYGGAAAALAADLVNLVRGSSFDREQVASAIQRHAPTLPWPSGNEASQIMEWAQELQDAFGDIAEEQRVDVINGLLLRSACRPTISTHDDQPPHLHYHGEGEGVVNRVRAVTATGLAYVLCEEGGRRLGRCADEQCGKVYIDVSKGGNRQFCSTRCSNRVNAGRHRARQRTSMRVASAS